MLVPLSLGRKCLEIRGRPIAGFGIALAKWSSGSRIARPHGRGLLVLYGFGFRHLSSHYGCQGETLGWPRSLCCGSLLRNFVDPALVVSEDFGVGTMGVNPAELLSSTGEISRGC